MTYTRPMQEVPECANCGFEIYGGKGDWWHRTPNMDREGDVKCPTGVGIATPKKVPAPLDPLIQQIQTTIQRDKAELVRKFEMLEAYMDMRENEKTQACCPDMQQHLDQQCELHNWWECPDVVVHKNDLGVIGIPIHDGGSSFIAIDFCPWCGKNVMPV